MIDQSRTFQQSLSKAEDNALWEGAKGLGIGSLFAGGLYGIQRSILNAMDVGAVGHELEEAAHLLAHPENPREFLNANAHFLDDSDDDI